MTQQIVQRLLVGSRNAGKLIEIKELLHGLPILICNLAEYPEVPEVEESGLTYEENSKLKAVQYASWTRVPTLADDSGLEVDALGGSPGVNSARFAGDNAKDLDRTQKLLALLNGRPHESRGAKFVCCLTLAGWRHAVDAETVDPSVISVSRGEIEGRINSSPRGTQGFGYDPIFVPNGYTETLAELPSTIKNVISHRAKALAIMKGSIERWIRQT